MGADAFYLDVVFKLPLGQPFSYFSRTPVLLYSRVVCLFGARELVGIVVGVRSGIEEDADYEIRGIVSCLDEIPLIDEKSFKLAQWVSFFYRSSLGEALSLFLPFSKVTRPLLKKIKPSLSNKEIRLNAEQEDVFQKIISSTKSTFLLKGITGSGKTYVYIKLIEYYKRMGKQTILLLSEINLTPQVEEKLSSFFNPQEIAIVHSQISAKKKLEYLLRFQEGEITALIGTRSAVFAIPKDLGLIILDEEHEDTFKNDAVPRYHARQVAQKISKEYGAKLLLGSATPSIESYYQAKQAHIDLLALSTRYYGSDLPKPQLIEKHFDSEDLIDERMIELLKLTKDEGKKSMIYINRRGYASSVRCRDCKTIYLCKRCNVSYTYHKKRGVYLCHYCASHGRESEPCKSCGSQKKEPMGAGVEKVEAELHKKIEDIKILRLDRDVLTTEKKLRKALKDFSAGLYDVMIGTQILTKGHDFPDVRRVFALYPENELSLADFRASQRTYNQIVQVSGRAGRREERGEVYVQSQMGDHYSISLGMEQNYEAFYEIEIERREAFSYPPFSRLFRFVIRGKNEKDVVECAKNLKTYLSSVKDESFGEILGPSPCIFSKIKDNYRWNLLIKVRGGVNLFLEKLGRLQSDFKYKSHRVYIEYDMDPLEIL